MYRGACSQPQASTSRRAIHSAVGCAVAAIHRVMLEDQQAIQKSERDRWHPEQVHRGDAIRMIAQKRLPSLGRRPPPPRLVLGHARLPDINAELDQLAVDPRRAPERLARLMSRIN